jgi:nucleotide-binding universal stress UspA family protein
MDYKTILVHVDDAPDAPDRMAYATLVANAQRAHLIGLAQTGISNFIRETTLPGVELGDLTPLFADLRNAAEQRAAQFDTVARNAGVASFAHRIDDEDAGMALAAQALYADLVITGQAHPAPGIAGLPEYVALNSPSPVLVLPRHRACHYALGRVMLAWNASPEAARAARLALPLLARAGHVELAVFDDESSSVRSPEDAAAMVQFLARHGVAVEACRHHPRGPVGNALLVRAEERKVDLLVMGCYGHSRYREILLGGVTRTVLQRASMPVLLAH